MALDSSPSRSYFLNGEECYMVLKRDCDDPYLNFERIKNQQVWLKREERIHAAKMKELNERAQS